MTPLSELKSEQTDRIGKMREIKSQISNLMNRLDHESKTLLSSFSQLQPENEADMTMHSLVGLLPQQNTRMPTTQKDDLVEDKENSEAVNID